MPTTLTGLILIALLILPGIAYVAIRERATPDQQRSTFRETAAVVVAGIIANVASLTLILIVAHIWPQATPNIDNLIRNPGKYWQEHYGLSTAWMLVLVAVASAISSASAWLISRRGPHMSTMSSWWVLFDHWNPNSTRIVQCELDDGSHVSGKLGDWNTTGSESADRDIILVEPITYRPAGDSEYHEHPVSAVCISASRIVVMFVKYKDSATSSPAAADSEAPTAQ